jgi:PhnB protein
MRVEPHLTFRGDCEEAFLFYERLFGGKLVLLSYGSSPAVSTVPEEWRSKIVHATLTLADGNTLLGADVLPEQFERPQGFYVLAALRDAAEGQRVFDALADGGSVRMPLQKTFWSPSFGAVVDRFGTPWEITVE